MSVKILILFLGIAGFSIFFVGARKLSKNRMLWGFIGAAAAAVPFYVLFPIAIQIASASAGGGDAVYSYLVINFAISVAVAVAVYRKLLLKAPTVKDE